MDKRRIKEFEKVKKIIKSNYDSAMFGLFNTKYIIGDDDMSTIFNGKYFMVDICYNYGYFEVFGTTDDEFDELLDLYYELDKIGLYKQYDIE